MPAPSGLSPSIEDIVKAERNAAGSMIGEKITQKQKFELNWKYLTAAELSQLFTALKTTFFFSMTFLDPKTNTTRTATFYAGSPSCTMLKWNNGVPTYTDIKCNIIEK